MADDYLASGFADVDAGKAAAFTGCLSLVDSLPFFQAVKAHTYERLRLAPGLAVLDVGCGLGDDARRLAARVAPGGHVTGVDSSRVMVEQARARNPGDAACTFQDADARSLPFPDASFDRARIDRVLMHVAESGRVVAEAARVLRPGGWLVAYDNDWGTLAVSSPDRAVTRLVLDAWCDAFPNGWVGRDLPGYFRAAGLADVTAEPATFATGDRDLAERLFQFGATAAHLVRAGRLPQAVADGWLADLAAQAARGALWVSLTAWTVTGRKPGAA